MDVYDWTQHLAMLTKYANFLTRDRSKAQDLVQDTYIRILTAAPTFDGKYPHAWCITIMRNLFYTESRDGARRAKLLMTYTRDDVQPPNQEDALYLKQLLALIPNVMSDAQAVVVMARALGNSVEEVAQAINIPANTVKSRHARGLSRLNHFP